MAGVVTLSSSPLQVSAFPLNVSVVPPAHGCTRSPVLILLCARCSATVTSPCSNLLVRTVSATAPYQEHPWGSAGLGPSSEMFGGGGLSLEETSPPSPERMLMVPQGGGDTPGRCQRH